MITTHPGRAAALGLLLSLALGTHARASNFFHRLCHPKKCAETERVVLPQQQVEVVRERPSVVVREVVPAARHKRSTEVGIVPIQTVYMPLAMPMVPAMPAFPAARDICDTRDLEFNPLEAVHRAELAAFRSDQAKRELEVTVEAQQRALQRFTAPTRSTTPEPIGSRGAGDAAMEQRLNQLSDEIQKLNNRVTAVEKLLIYHDNLIMQGAGRSTVPAGPGIPPVGSALPMVPPPSRDVPSRPADVPSAATPGTAPPMLPPPTPYNP